MNADLELKSQAEQRAYNQSLKGQASRMFEKLRRYRETMTDEEGIEVLTEENQELLEGYLPAHPTMMAFFLSGMSGQSSSSLDSETTKGGDGVISYGRM